MPSRQSERRLSGDQGRHRKVLWKTGELELNRKKKKKRQRELQISVGHIKSGYEPTDFLVLCVCRSAAGWTRAGCPRPRLRRLAGLGLPALRDSGQNLEQALEIQAQAGVRGLAVCGGRISNWRAWENFSGVCKQFSNFNNLVKFVYVSRCCYGTTQTLFIGQFFTSLPNRASIKYCLLWFCL